MAVLGLDLGGTKLASAVFSLQGDIINKETIPLGGRTGTEVGHLILEQIRKFLSGSDADNTQEIEGIGVSVPGIYYADTGRVWAPNIPGWEEYPLLDEIRQNLHRRIPVKIDSDRAAYILGESWQGVAQGIQDAIFVAVGTGIGAGILIDGKILRGANDIAGAIGWLALSKPYYPKYDVCGDFEYHASGDGLARVARELLSRDKKYDGELRQIEPEEVTGKEIFAACENGDPLAAKVLQNAIEYWGRAAANLVSLFNPEKIIFGGGVFGPAAQFLPEIRKEAEQWAQPISIQHVTIEATSLGGDAGLYGTGKLALLALES